MKKNISNITTVFLLKIFFLIIFFILAGHVFSEEKEAESPTRPVSPNKPERPSVSGIEKKGFSQFPSLPNPPLVPGWGTETNEPAKILENYELNISGAHPNGDIRKNVASAIKKAQYTLYSNKTMVIKLVFNDGIEYIYYMKNPRAKIELSSGVFRETYETTVQVGNEFLLERYTSEILCQNNLITSFSLIGDNKVIVQLKFTKKI